jgi:hypothetical protein
VQKTVTRLCTSSLTPHLTAGSTRCTVSGNRTFLMLPETIAKSALDFLDNRIREVVLSVVREEITAALKHLTAPSGGSIDRNPSQPPPSEWMTTKEAQTLLRVSRQTIFRRRVPFGSPRPKRGTWRFKVIPNGKRLAVRYYRADVAASLISPFDL